jgi:hypothetical protein
MHGDPARPCGVAGPDYCRVPSWAYLRLNGMTANRRAPETLAFETSAVDELVVRPNEAVLERVLEVTVGEAVAHQASETQSWLAWRSVEATRGGRTSRAGSKSSALRGSRRPVVTVFRAQCFKSVARFPTAVPRPRLRPQVIVEMEKGA